ncbi:DUF4082 domain-containing protein [Nocardioides sp. CER19]|uniref:DUF4082 domain-containing protein n=1 Tax=Nocardioides sp. CER19 TaxID=3038538 RepID=UPI002447AD6D|nr:DUF4082 domain-containing protein [Nocardioides sp. CER19]MDH2414835.1 DUF4082 domain-containing protein [Nocardioides sp. CER19]
MPVRERSLAGHAPGRRLPTLTRRQRVVIGVVALALVVGAGVLVLTGGGDRWSGAVSLLPDDEVPKVLTEPDGRPVELGLRFRVDRSAEAIAAQYYRGPGDTGPHPATLWSGDGRKLAVATFADGSAAGLQTARFGDPPTLRPGTDYVISYTANDGRYSADEHYFTDAVSRGPLSARPDAGVYDYAPGGFPSKTHEAASYTVDIVVRPPGSSSQPPTPPAGTTAPPAAGATPVPTPSPTDTPSPSGTPPPTVKGGRSPRFPTADTAGVPAGWKPRKTVDGRYVVSRPGAVVEDLRVNGSIEIAADDVTLRRVEVVGGSIGNWPSGASCTTGLLLQQVSVLAGPGEDTAGLGAAISTGGYTADRVKIDGLPEGMRVGGKPQGCGPVVVRDSWVRVTAPADCAGLDWHGDAIQGWEGARLTVRDSVFVLADRRDCMGTAPFFYPDQGNTSVDIDGLLVQGGGYSFRLGTPGSVRNLDVVADASWFGPLDVKCGLLSAWDARLVRLDHGQPVPVSVLPCD